VAALDALPSSTCTAHVQDIFSYFIWDTSGGIGASAPEVKPFLQQLPNAETC